MQRLARLITRRARITLVMSLAVIVVFGVLGGGAFEALHDGGFDDPKSDSVVAQRQLQQQYGGDTNLLLLVTPVNKSLDDPAVTAAGRKLTTDLRAEPEVQDVQSYWPYRIPQLRASDSSSALIAVQLEGVSNETGVGALDVVDRYAKTDDTLKVEAGGLVGANRDINNEVQEGLTRSELIAIPLTLVLLVIAFGALVAALLPLIVGIIAIAGTLAVLCVLGSITDVSIYALNLTTAMGLGLSIDYALLIVSRYREELANGCEPEAAVVKTMSTAGRTIVFSGATVAVALAALLVFPTFFLRSFAYAGIAVVVVAMFGAIVVLPAVLALLGRRVDKFKMFGRAPQYGESKFWHAVATTVYRRPILTGLPVFIALIVMALPLSNVSFATPDDRVIQGAPSRTVGDAIREQYAGGDANSMFLLLNRPASANAERDYMAEVSKLQGVNWVASLVGTAKNGQATVAVNPLVVSDLQRANGNMIRISINVDPMSDRAQHLVHEIRSMQLPDGTTGVLGGQSAILVDGKHAIGSKLPLAFTLIIITTFILLFAFTGSLLLPVKALVMNALTLSAVLGLMTWIFQEGHLAGVLGFTPQPLSTTMPVLLFCIAFGLSMDYEVFLLSRIKEAHDAGATNETAVVEGLSKTGRIVTTAALLLAVTFFSFGVSKVSFMQFFGLGTGLAVVLDATIVRGVLVPAFMRLAGDANWWAPRPLRKLHQYIALSEAPTSQPAPMESSHS